MVAGTGVKVESGLSTVSLILILYKPNAPIKAWAKIKKTKNPFNPNHSINNEHKIGPLIAPTPNINCNPPPAATNFDLGTKSFVCARLSENKGKHKLEYSPTAMKKTIFLNVQFLIFLSMYVDILSNISRNMFCA